MCGYRRTRKKRGKTLVLGLAGLSYLSNSVQSDQVVDLEMVSLRCSSHMTDTQSAVRYHVCLQLHARPSTFPTIHSLLFRQRLCLLHLWASMPVQYSNAWFRKLCETLEAEDLVIELADWAGFLESKTLGCLLHSRNHGWRTADEDLGIGRGGWEVFLSWIISFCSRGTRMRQCNLPWSFQRWQIRHHRSISLVGC